MKRPRVCVGDWRSRRLFVDSPSRFVADGAKGSSVVGEAGAASGTSASSPKTTETYTRRGAELEAHDPDSRGQPLIGRLSAFSLTPAQTPSPRGSATDSERRHNPLEDEDGCS